MSKVILYIATSLDGYIATPDGGIGWLMEFDSEAEDYGCQEFFDRLGALVIGGKTYRQVLGFEEWPYSGVITYVITRQENVELPDESVVPYSGEMAALVDHLRQTIEKDIWLVGGGELNAIFLQEGLIDEYIISVMPLLLGDGIPLVHGIEKLTNLTLTNSKVYPNGVVQLQYTNRKQVASNTSP